jgi:hypothetical protein
LGTTPSPIFEYVDHRASIISTARIAHLCRIAISSFNNLLNVWFYCIISKGYQHSARRTKILYQRSYAKRSIIGKCNLKWRHDLNHEVFRDCLPEKYFLCRFSFVHFVVLAMCSRSLLHYSVDAAVHVHQRDIGQFLMAGKTSRGLAGDAAGGVVRAVGVAALAPGFIA